MSSYAGPMPPPEMLVEYEAIVPGAAERIIVQFEEQSRHRREMEKIAIPSGIRRSYAGLIFGTIVALATLGVAAYAFYKDQPASGVALVIAEIVALVGVFIYAAQAGKTKEPTDDSKQKATSNRSIRKR